jgi:hypothetical protein
MPIYVLSLKIARFRWQGMHGRDEKCVQSLVIECRKTYVSGRIILKWVLNGASGGLILNCIELAEDRAWWRELFMCSCHGVGANTQFHELILSSFLVVSNPYRFGKAKGLWNVPVPVFVWVLVESRLTDGVAQQGTVCAVVVPECEH